MGINAKPIKIRWPQNLNQLHPSLAIRGIPSWGHVAFYFLFRAQQTTLEFYLDY